MRAADLSACRQTPYDRQVSQAELAHDAGDDDEREQHAEEQVEEVVSRVDGRETDAQRENDEELSLARNLELPRRLERAAYPSGPALGARDIVGSGGLRVLW